MLAGKLSSNDVPQDNDCNKDPYGVVSYDVGILTNVGFIRFVSTFWNSVTDHSNSVDIRIHDVGTFQCSVFWNDFILSIYCKAGFIIFIFSMLTVLVSITEKVSVDTNS